MGLRKIQNKITVMTSAAALLTMLLFGCTKSDENNFKFVSIQDLDKMSDMKTHIELLGKTDWEKSIQVPTLSSDDELNKTLNSAVVTFDPRLIEVLKYDDKLKLAYIDSLVRYNARRMKTVDDKFNLMNDKLGMVAVAIRDGKPLDIGFYGEFKDFKGIGSPIYSLTLAPYFWVLNESNPSSDYFYSDTSQKTVSDVISEYLKKENDLRWVWLSVMLSPTYKIVNLLEQKSHRKEFVGHAFNADAASKNSYNLFQPIAIKAWGKCKEGDLLACWVYSDHPERGLSKLDEIQRGIQLCKFGVDCSFNIFLVRFAKDISEIGGEAGAKEIVEVVRQNCRLGNGCAGISSLAANKKLFSSYFIVKKDDNLKALDIRRWQENENNFKLNVELCEDGDSDSCDFAAAAPNISMSTRNKYYGKKCAKMRTISQRDWRLCDWKNEE